jgi:glycosyltransferase involved in cell wall biosynthesis
LLEAPNRGPLVSVVVPAFNAEATLAQTLDSISAQDYGPLEILIVDDGSTDSTAEIAARFCAAEPRARLLRKANGGVASARNRGIREAKGDYVAPIDADDVWHPAKISRQVAAALAAPEPPGFVYCWFRDIDEAGRVWRDGPALSVAGPALQRLAYSNFVGNGSAPLIPRAALLAVGGYDESLRRFGAEGCEDLLVQFRLAERHPVALVPEYLVGYRLRSGSMSSDPDRMVRSWQKAMEVLDARDALSPRARRWNEASHALLLAESRALRREIGPALGSLGRAARRDPVRTGVHLLLRTARHLGRRIASRPAQSSFEDHSAGTPSPVTDRWLLALARFDQRRLERIRRLER